MLGNPTIHDKERQKFFKKTFGYFDKGLYNMMTNKFRKLYEVYRGIFESSQIAKVLTQMMVQDVFKFEIIQTRGRGRSW